MSVFPKGQGTPYVIWIAYPWSLRIAYAITVVAYAEDMPLHASAEALRADLRFAYANIHMTRPLHSMMTGVRAHITKRSCVGIYF